MPFETLNLIEFVNIIYFMTGSTVASPTFRARQRHKDIFYKGSVADSLYNGVCKAAPGFARVC